MKSLVSCLVRQVVRDCKVEGQPEPHLHKDDDKGASSAVCGQVKRIRRAQKDLLTSPSPHVRNLRRVFFSFSLSVWCYNVSAILSILFMAFLRNTLFTRSLTSDFRRTRHLLALLLSFSLTLCSHVPTICQSLEEHLLPTSLPCFNNCCSKRCYFPALRHPT